MGRKLLLFALIECLVARTHASRTRERTSWSLRRGHRTLEQDQTSRRRSLRNIHLGLRRSMNPAALRPR